MPFSTLFNRTFPLEGKYYKSFLFKIKDFQNASKMTFFPSKTKILLSEKYNQVLKKFLPFSHMLLRILLEPFKYWKEISETGDKN